MAIALHILKANGEPYYPCMACLKYHDDGPCPTTFHCRECGAETKNHLEMIVAFKNNEREGPDFKRIDGLCPDCCKKIDKEKNGDPNPST